MYIVCVKKNFTLDNFQHIIVDRQSMKTEGDANVYEFYLCLVSDIFSKIVIIITQKPENNSRTTLLNRVFSNMFHMNP